MKQLLFLSACLVMCMSCSENNSVLMQLDMALTDYQHYIDLKDVELEKLKEHLQKSETKEDRYNTTMDLYRAYQDFSLDSSLVYIKQSLKLADELGNQERIIDTHLSLAFLYNYVGMHNEALKIFKEQDVTGHSDWLRRSHFYLGTNVYRNLSEYSVDEEQKDYYRHQMEICRDSAIAYAPNDVILRAERLEDSGKMQEAIELLSTNLPDGLTTREAGLKYYILSEIYEKLHQRDAK